MLLVYLGSYTLILVVLWVFFIIAKIHLYKFKNFSTNIKKVTVILTIFLTILSLIGYILIFSMGLGGSETKLDNSSKIRETYY